MINREPIEHIVESGHGQRVTEELSIVCSDGTRAVMVPFGEQVPATGCDTFGAAIHDQRSVEIRLVAGGALATSPCRVIAVIRHPIEQPVARGKPLVEVKLTVDALGAIEVEVTERKPARVVRYRGPALRVAITGAKLWC